MTQKAIANNQIYGFDVLKMVMALFIVAIHAKPFEDSPMLYGVFAPFMSVSVPLFFILSSFFLFRKLNTNGYRWSILFCWFKRIGVLYLFWLAVNLPFVVRDRLLWVNEPFYRVIWYVIRDLLFSHTFAGSWFLSALVFGVTGAFLIKKFLRSDMVLLLMAVVVGFFLKCQDVLPVYVNDVYSWLVTNIREELELTPLMGIIWCNVGCVLASDWMKRFLDFLKTHYYVLFLPIGFFFYLLMMKIDSVYELSKFGLIISLFVIGYCVRLPESPIYKVIRSYSILFYFQHFIWLRVYPVTFGSIVNTGGVSIS